MFVLSVEYDLLQGIHRDGMYDIQIIMQLGVNLATKRMPGNSEVRVWREHSWYGCSVYIVSRKYSSIILIE